MSDIWNHKKQLLIKEYELLISMLMENKRTELQIRNWCLTLWVIIFGSSIKLQISSDISLILSLLIVIAFFFSSISQSYFLTKTSERIFYVQDKLDKYFQYTDEEINSINTPTILRKSSIKETIKETLHGLKHKNILGFYIIMVLLSVLAYYYIIPKYS